MSVCVLGSVVVPERSFSRSSVWGRIHASVTLLLQMPKPSPSAAALMSRSPSSPSPRRSSSPVSSKEPSANAAPVQTNAVEREEPETGRPASGNVESRYDMRSKKSARAAVESAAFSSRFPFKPESLGIHDLIKRGFVAAALPLRRHSREEDVLQVMFRFCCRRSAWRQEPVSSSGPRTEAPEDRSSSRLE